MSVYIPGMEMPTSCNECPLHKLWPWDDEVQCLVNRELWNDNSGRHKLCPLVPVPPHGRLIDESELPWCVDWYAGRKRYYTTPKTVEHLSTIIPAEGGEEE